MSDFRPDKDDTVGSLYVRLRSMASGFEFKPGERINESALSRSLGASRTPLREALNRLVAEGFIDFRSGQGFFCRNLSPERIQSLYEARLAVECEAVRRASLRATPDQIAGLADFLNETDMENACSPGADRLLKLDEMFHLRLCRLARNPEFLRLLENIYDRIRIVRAADIRRLQSAGRTSTSRHREILDTVASGDPQAAADAMRSHIERRAKYATEAVRMAFADLYAPIEDGQ